MPSMSGATAISEDIGDNIELWFVDPTGTGEYHLTMDPGEVDALAHVPGAGLGTLEALNGGGKAQRFTNTNGTTLARPYRGDCPAWMNSTTLSATSKSSARLST